VGEGPIVVLRGSVEIPGPFILDINMKSMHHNLNSYSCVRGKVYPYLLRKLNSTSALRYIIPVVGIKLDYVNRIKLLL